MDSFSIRGPSRLEGTVVVSGAKNAMLPVMAASLLTGGRCTLGRVPVLRDTRTMMKLLGVLGVPSSLEGDRLEIDAANVTSFEAPYDLVRTMRASIYALGPLLARYGKARVSLPGGCAWGPRPVDIHIRGMMSLGATVRIDHGYIDAAAARLRGAEMILPVPSVGATINIMMAAVLADGRTVIDNAAREPEVVDLALALKRAGALIEGEGTSTITVTGVTDIAPIVHDIMPDRIETGTFAAAAAITGGRIEIRNCRPEHLRAVVETLKLCGATVTESADVLVVAGPICRRRSWRWHAVPSARAPSSNTSIPTVSRTFRSCAASVR
jgi:UDP-N-acetylglucosamine 1-carboxyvinyltransferase